jgi:hypothetical protein
MAKFTYAQNKIISDLIDSVLQTLYDEDILKAPHRFISSNSKMYKKTTLQ